MILLVAHSLQPVDGFAVEGFPLTLELDAANLPKKSWVKISQIRTLSVERLSGKIGRAKPEEVELAITGLNQIVAP